MPSQGTRRGFAGRSPARQASPGHLYAPGLSSRCTPGHTGVRLLQTTWVWVTWARDGNVPSLVFTHLPSLPSGEVRRGAATTSPGLSSPLSGPSATDPEPEGWKRRSPTALPLRPCPGDKAGEPRPGTNPSWIRGPAGTLGARVTLGHPGGWVPGDHRAGEGRMTQVPLGLGESPRSGTSRTEGQSLRPQLPTPGRQGWGDAGFRAGATRFPRPLPPLSVPVLCPVDHHLLLYNRH